MAQSIKMTQEAYDKLLKRLEELKKEQAENLVAIADARSQGDLSENADYSAARERQGQINTELKEIENNLKNAEIIEASDSNNMLKYITIKFLDFEDDGEDDTETYQIVGSIGADAVEGKISSESPLGKAILTAKVGEVVMVRTEDGERFEVKILKISAKDPKKK